MPYRLFVPGNYNGRMKYPLVLWLHGGRGPRSDDLKPISDGNRIGSHIWVSPASQRKHPCFVAAPLCPANQMWTSLDPVEPTNHLRLTLALLNDLLNSYSIDPQRLYVAGQSMGGFGAWAIACEAPNRFAAAVAVCGGGNESKAPMLVETPLWAFHGEKDEAVSVERSRSMVAAVRRAGGRVRYSEYKGEGHVIWERAFKEPGLIPWVFEQRLGKGA